MNRGFVVLRDDLSGPLYLASGEGWVQDLPLARIFDQRLVAYETGRRVGADGVVTLGLARWMRGPLVRAGPGLLAR